MNKHQQIWFQIERCREELRQATLRVARDQRLYADDISDHFAHGTFHSGNLQTGLIVITRKRTSNPILSIINSHLAGYGLTVEDSYLDTWLFFKRMKFKVKYDE